jgi:uncharacterized metal-binding protein YceD (DUF177 family)
MLAKDTAIHGGVHITEVLTPKRNKVTKKATGTTHTAEADGHSVGQDVHTAFHDPEVSLQCSRCLSLAPVLSQLNPTYIYTLVH